MTDLVGKTLGNYEIIELIGQGGMANVYRARQNTLNRDVAIKILSGMQARDQIFRQRFVREAKAVAQLSHPNIVSIYDFGDNEELSLLYIVMELITGGSLRDWKTKQMPIEEAVPIIATVAQALTTAHQRDIIHRDIKPNNILIAADGRPMLSDFGLAQMGEGSLYTEAGTTVGTPAYMAPEQVMGEKLDGRADIYSMGMVLYELLTGRPAFQADTPLALLHQQVYENPPSPRELNAKISRSLEAVLLRSIAKDRNERHRTSEEFASELLKTLSDGSDATVQVRLPSVKTVTTTEIMPVNTITGRLARLTRRTVKRAQQAFWWLVRNLFRLTAGAVLALILLSLAGAFSAAYFAERSIVEYPWQWSQFAAGQTTTFDDAYAQRHVNTFMQSFGAREGVLPLISVRWQPEEILQTQIDTAIGTYYVDSRIFVKAGALQTEVEAVNGYVPYVLGNIVSEGVNRGLRRAFTASPLRVESVVSEVGKIKVLTRARENETPATLPTTPSSTDPATPAPTPTR